MRKTKRAKKPKVAMKAETLDEFLARGGQIERVPYIEPEQKVEPIRANSSGGLPTLMTLPDGAHFFGETRKKKPTKEDFVNKLNKANLPQSVVESLTKSVKDKK
jgi:hypothetical protein